MAETAASLTDRLQELKRCALAELERVGEPQALEAWRVAYLGRRSGSLTQALRGLGALQPEERREAGALANDVKAVLESRLTDREESLRAASLERTAQCRTAST